MNRRQKSIIRDFIFVVVIIVLVVVGLVNLIAVLETGSDLRGKPWPAITAAGQARAVRARPDPSRCRTRRTRPGTRSARGTGDRAGVGRAGRARSDHCGRGAVRPSGLHGTRSAADAAARRLRDSASRAPARPGMARATGTDVLWRKFAPRGGIVSFVSRHPIAPTPALSQIATAWRRKPQRA